MKYAIKNMCLLTAFVIFVSACGKTTSENKTEHTDEEEHSSEVKISEEQKKAIGLETSFFTQRNLGTALKVNGKLMLPPQNRAEVSILMGGIVRDILVKEGAMVNKGDILATIENTEFIQLQQDYLQSSSAITYLKAEYERQKELQKENINSQKTFQKAEADYKYEVSNYNALRQKLKLYNVDAGQLKAENISPSFHVIAPIPGNIHTISINIGKYAEPNKQLFDIVDNRFLHIDITIFEKDISKIREGQKITFTDANDPQHLHNASIFSINKAFEDGQQAIIAHAKIDDVTESLLPGMFIEARINIDNKTTSALPDEAIVSNGSEHYIFIEQEGGIYKQLSVKIGTSDQGFTEVIPLEDVKPETKIVTKGAYYLLSELTKGEGGHHD
jgi:cobalt-zinc-cadmium efflux system membrane fusion protein